MRMRTGYTEEEMREVVDDLRKFADGWWTKPDECKEYLNRFHEVALKCLDVAIKRADYDDDSSLVDALFYRECIENMMEDIVPITDVFG